MPPRVLPRVAGALTRGPEITQSIVTEWTLRAETERGRAVRSKDGLPGRSGPHMKGAFMRSIILAAGRFDEALRADIAKKREPRLDIFELERELNARVIDFQDVERSRDPLVKLVARTAGKSAAVALLGFRERANCDAYFTTGEDIGLPLSVLLKPTGARCSHTMIVHTLFPAKKQAFFKIGRVGKAFDRILLYSTSEERLAIDQLGVPADRVQRIYYHADQQFFCPDGRATEPDLICAAGQLLRDYDTLVDAIEGLPVRLQIAAGSPWIERPLQPKRTLPGNVTWGRLGRYELRELYARSAISVVPILHNGCRYSKQKHGRKCRDICMRYVQWIHSIYPHQCGCSVTNY